MPYRYNRLVQLLTRHEGVRQFPYRDTVGKLTIGVGFNLDDEGLYPEEIDFILSNRIDRFIAEARRAFPVYNRMSHIRKMVIIDMLYNLGQPRLAGFKRMWAAIEKGDYEEAAKEMLDSKWADQVGVRARRLANMMQFDRWPEDL